MNKTKGEEAVEFLDLHIERDLLAHYGNGHDFDEHMNDLRVLVERDKPKEVEIYEDDDGFEEGYGRIIIPYEICPSCRKKVGYKTNYAFCPHCGQRLER